MKRNWTQRAIHLPIDQDDGKPGNRLFQEIPAVDQRVEPIPVLRQLNDDVRMQGSFFANEQQPAKHARHAKRAERDEKRRSKRHRAHHRPVRINRSAELKR